MATTAHAKGTRQQGGGRRIAKFEISLIFKIGILLMKKWD
jgi:hypothetical protein